MTEPDSLRRLAEAAEPRAHSWGLTDVLGEGGTEVLLIRHAQVEQSEAGEDLSLTQTGREQAQALAVFLERLAPLDGVYSSPYRRALETAEAVARPRSLPVEVIDDLREMETFLPEGKSFRDVLGDDGWHAMEERILQERRWDARYIEPSERLRARVAAAVESAVGNNPGRRVALVTHGPLIMAYVSVLARSTLDILFYPGLTSVTAIRALDRRRDLHVLNSMAHLDAL